MGDSVANPVRVSNYKSLSWVFKCTSWQYDRILERCQFSRRRSWDNFSVCHTDYPSGKPPDIIVIQFRYKDRGCLVLPFLFWVRKDAFLGGRELDDREMKLLHFRLEMVFHDMNPELCIHLKFDLMREVMDVARTLASMPQNVGREGLSFVYEVSASFKFERVNFVDDVANSETQVCAVCLGDISQGDDVVRLPCRHIYHGGCILGWLERKPTCPTCRMALPMDSC